MQNSQPAHFALLTPTRVFLGKLTATAAIFAMLVGGAVVACPAQEKYQPDMDEIRRMAEGGVQFIESGLQRLNGENLCLAALTISEVTKRYERRIPYDNPVVQKSIEEIVGLVNTEADPNRASLERNNNLYFPSLALILLCDVNDDKYRAEIVKLIRVLEDRQLPSGAYNYRANSEKDPSVGDISQTQYACLAFFVAKHHGFKVKKEVLKATLEWLMDEQTPEGSWYYHTRGQRPVAKMKIEKKLTLSRHCCGLGTTYLLSDLLQLSPRVGGNSKNKKTGTGLPPSVSVYIKPKPGMDNESKEGPLVNINGSQLATTKRKGNVWLDKNFSIEINNWNYYYLYGLERYAFFREQAEGEVRERPDWYDQGVEFLKGMQDGNGGFRMTNKNSIETPIRATCLATLFLVRSSEVLILPMTDSLLKGAEGFPEDTPLQESRGTIQGKVAVKNIEDVMNLLSEDRTDEQLRMLADSMDDAIRKFTSDETKSKAETLAFLTGLVKDRRFFKRLIAVKFLAREQTIDNVPALLYALGDPDIRICQEAHDGLRLISRKIDAYRLPAKPTLDDFKLVKRDWTKWFLEIRPGADLID